MRVLKVGRMIQVDRTFALVVGLAFLASLPWLWKLLGSNEGTHDSES